jgi:hypothetical protein
MDKNTHWKVTRNAPIYNRRIDIIAVIGIIVAIVIDAHYRMNDEHCANKSAAFGQKNNRYQRR